MARDFPSLVRVLCSAGNFERAAQVVEESGSKAAAYLLASRLRMEKEVKGDGLDLEASYVVYIL